MTAQFILLLIISLIVLVLAVIILSGKGDNLIAGYNTSTKEEKGNETVCRRTPAVYPLLKINRRKKL